MPTEDRERQFERALSQHLRNASPDSSCPDAEILAAYHERTLCAGEMARWKEHIARCAHCQESLALVEQTEDLLLEEWESGNVPVPLEELGLLKRMHGAEAGVLEDEEILAAQTIQAAPINKVIARPGWRWIVPLGALAASVIVWVGVRETQRQQSESVGNFQVAENRRAAPQAPAAAYESADRLKKEESPAQNSNQAFRSQNAAPAPTAKLANPKVRVPLAVPSPPPRPAIDAEITKQKDLGFSATDKFAATAPAPPMPRDLAKSRAERAPAPSGANATAPSGAAVGGAIGGAVANRPAQEKIQAPVPEAAETVEVQAEAAPSDASRLDRSKRAVAGLMRQANEDRHYILALGENPAWHVGEAGKIEHSIDFGLTWKLQKSGVTADLTAGAAPSNRVCWIVGKAGTVLLTTDGGKHWRPVPSPITEDLAGVHATDALHASIWDVSNRKSFETSDGGATWKQTSHE